MNNYYGLIIHEHIFSDIYLEWLLKRGILKTLQEMATFYDREVQNCSYLLMLNMLALKPKNSLRKYFKIATTLFPTGLQILYFCEWVSKNFKQKKIVWNFLNIYIYIYIPSEKGTNCTSNLVYVASCHFFPTHYDVYWPLSNAALSGVTSECPFHNKNIPIH